MPPKSEDDETGPDESGGSGLDRMSALPNEVIHHLLGLLLAPDAVWTSVLAKGWLHHWKSMRSLRFAAFDGDPILQSADWLNTFMARLRRELRAPLDVCNIYVEEGLRDDDVTDLDAHRWVRRAVAKHHVRELTVNIEQLICEQPSFELTGQAIRLWAPGETRSPLRGAEPEGS